MEHDLKTNGNLATSNWWRELQVSITVCDTTGVIVEMNEKSITTFKSEGGAALVGTNVLDCHPEPARTQLAEMLADKSTNVYTIEKNGVKKLIYQTPWSVNGEYMGYVEISLEIPWELRHFVRAL